MREEDRNILQDKKETKPKSSISNPVTTVKKASKIDRMVYGKRGYNISNAAYSAYGNTRK